MSSLRWEVNYDGSLLWKEAASLSRNRAQGKVQLIKELFERDGWVCEILDSGSKFIKIQVSNSHTNESVVYNVALSNVVNEYRSNSGNPESNSSYEKRIQGQDFQEVNCTNKLVFGVYAIEDEEDINQSVIVSWPEEILTSGSNRAYRVNTKENIQPARVVGLYADKNSAYNVVTFKPENIYIYLKNKEILHRYINSLPTEESGNSHMGNLMEAIDYPYNRIVFGAPGTGKSHRLEEDKEAFHGNFERVTFHANYSYAHFVGTYKPVPVKERNAEGVEVTTITYKYVPGPFMRTYVKAMKSLKTTEPQPFLLLIEEINRANVAAVFGEVFQLLDREDGVSQYEIEASEDMKAYLHEELGGDESEHARIRIPNNMYIWATMNSADQGVLPMDTAFKRRWDFEYLGIDENDEEIKGKVILGTGSYGLEVKWNQLRKAINEKLTEDYKVNEDKLMGPYFLSREVIKTVSDTDDTIADQDKFKNAFKNKVIMYLYEDAVKQHKHKLFDGCNSAGYSTAKYSSICKAFDEIGVDIFGDGFRELYDNQGA